MLQLPQNLLQRYWEISVLVFIVLLIFTRFILHFQQGQAEAVPKQISSHFTTRTLILALFREAFKASANTNKMCNSPLRGMLAPQCFLVFLAPHHAWELSKMVAQTNVNGTKTYSGQHTGGAAGMCEGRMLWGVLWAGMLCSKDDRSSSSPLKWINFLCFLSDCPSLSCAGAASPHVSCGVWGTTV